MRNLAQDWYRESLHGITFFLLPFSWLFSFIIIVRRYLYKIGFFKIHHFSVPVIVVGNVTVGGTGKTPFVIWLAHFLQARGYSPGIVSRGVGGKKQYRPHRVTSEDTANRVGDEALLLLQKSNCPVVVGRNRVAALQLLLQQTHCDVVLSDDGLQHYSLGRCMEIAVVDGVRRFGNRQLLPAGPLREPIARLKNVNFVVVNGGPDNNQDKDEWIMSLESTVFVSLKNLQNEIIFTAFPHKKIHAVAGIGYPERFFNGLKKVGFDVIEHPFPDHYQYHLNDFNFNDSLAIVMTEKDAVKCISFADERYWCVPIKACMSEEFGKKIIYFLSTNFPSVNTSVAGELPL